MGYYNACSKRGANPRHVKVIVTQFDAVTDQNRNQLVITGFQQRIRVDVDHDDLRSEFGQQRLERGAHVVA